VKKLKKIGRRLNSNLPKRKKNEWDIYMEDNTIVRAGTSVFLSDSYQNDKAEDMKQYYSHILVY